MNLQKEYKTEEVEQHNLHSVREFMCRMCSDEEKTEGNIIRMFKSTKSNVRAMAKVLAQGHGMDVDYNYGYDEGEHKSTDK